MPKLSIIIPSYNSAPYLEESINSVLKQFFVDFELIVIDDGSTDNTQAILKKYIDTRLHILSNNKNLGIVASLNRGIAQASGEYIIRFDADDVMLAGRLEKQSRFLDDNPNVVVVGSWAETINENGEHLGTYNYPPQDDAVIRKYILKHNPFIHPSTAIGREALLKAGSYRQAFSHIEDYELWTRLLRLGQGANLPEHLIKYRLNQGGITKRKNTTMRVKGLVVRVLAWARLSLNHWAH